VVIKVIGSRINSRHRSQIGKVLRSSQKPIDAVADLEANFGFQDLPLVYYA
jgi:hypothetical protein